MAETLGCVGADLGLPDPRGAAFFLGLLGAEDAADVAAGTWLVSSDMSLLNSGATRETRPETSGCYYCKQQTGKLARQTSGTRALRLRRQRRRRRRERVPPTRRLPRSAPQGSFVLSARGFFTAGTAVLGEKAK